MLIYTLIGARVRVRVCVWWRWRWILGLFLENEPGLDLADYGDRGHCGAPVDVCAPPSCGVNALRGGLEGTREVSEEAAASVPEAAAGRRK